MQLCSSRTKTAIIQNVFKIYVWEYRVDQTQHNKKICFIPHLDFHVWWKAKGHKGIRSDTKVSNKQHRREKTAQIIRLQVCYILLS